MPSPTSRRHLTRAVALTSLIAAALGLSACKNNHAIDPSPTADARPVDETKAPKRPPAPLMPPPPPVPGHTSR